MSTWAEGDNHIPQSPNYTSVNRDQDAFRLLCCHGKLLAHVQLAVNMTPQILLVLHLSSSVPSLYPCKGFFLPGCKTSHLSLLNFMKFLLAHSSGLSMSLWTAVLPSMISTSSRNLASSANMVNVCSLFPQVIAKDIKQDRSRDSALQCTCYHPPGRVRAINNYFLNLTIQPLFHPFICSHPHTVSS